MSVNAGVKGIDLQAKIITTNMKIDEFNVYLR